MLRQGCAGPAMACPQDLSVLVSPDGGLLITYPFLVLPIHFGRGDGTLRRVLVGPRNSRRRR